MRVLHFLPVYVPAWQFGGPILSVSRLCEGLVQEGVDVRVITTNEGLPDYPVEKLGVPQNVNGVQVTYYPVNQQGATIRSRALVEALSDHILWADLLHTSSIWQPLGQQVQKAAHSAGVPVIQALRGALGPYSWTRSFYKKLPYFLFSEWISLQRSAAIHCTTTQEIREAKWFPLKPPLELLPNPLDLHKLYTDNQCGIKWRLANNIPLDKRLFLVAGRLHHKKGLELLPFALSKLDSQQWHILFIGDDDDGTEAELRNSLDFFGLSPRCHWLPSMPSEELLGPLNAADWLLLPSRHENFGNIAPEALSCGCGVILSDRVGVSDMLVGCPGVMTGIRDVTVWTDLMAKALAQDRPSASSEEWVKNQFGLQIIAKQCIVLYRRILGYE